MLEIQFVELHRSLLGRPRHVSMATLTRWLWELWHDSRLSMKLMNRELNQPIFTQTFGIAGEPFHVAIVECVSILINYKIKLSKWMETFQLKSC